MFANGVTLTEQTKALADLIATVYQRDKALPWTHLAFISSSDDMRIRLASLKESPEDIAATARGLQQDWPGCVLMDAWLRDPWIGRLGCLAVVALGAGEPLVKPTATIRTHQADYWVYALAAPIAAAMRDQVGAIAFRLSNTGMGRELLASRAGFFPVPGAYTQIDDRKQEIAYVAQFDATRVYTFKALTEAAPEGRAPLSQAETMAALAKR